MPSLPAVEKQVHRALFAMKILIDRIIDLINNFPEWTTLHSGMEVPYIFAEVFLLRKFFPFDLVTIDHVRYIGTLVRVP